MKNIRNSSRNNKSKLSFWQRLDQNLVLYLVGFLLIFIPLYPKIPFFDLLEGYIVRLRLEDLLVAFAFFIWFIQLLRRKVVFPRNAFTFFLFSYLVVGFLSAIDAIFILHTVPLQRQHVFKLFLHYFRRLEYFSLYFLAYAAIRSTRDIFRLLTVSTITLLGTIIYGFGQKYLYWPAFSTMNREFSKGMRLYLTAHSRVMSTFAGHYDFAAYLMMALTFLVPAFWLIKNRWLKVAFGLLAFLTYWSLILTASRASWLGYMVGITAAALILAFNRGWFCALRRWLAVVFFSILVMFTLGDLSDRFLQLINDPSTLSRFLPYSTGQIEAEIYRVRDFTAKIHAFKNKLLTPFKPEPPADSISTDELARIAAKSDQPPKPSKEAAKQASLPPDITPEEEAKQVSLPPDVTPEEEAIRQKAASQSATATSSAKTKAGGGYSPNALKYGLSIAIRLDALWPRAIAGFKRNPLLGSGYSTLVKTNPNQFTQAESTDNDYLRMLGETGILGAVTFLALPFLVIYFALQVWRTTTSLGLRIISLGLISATIALLVNATYIDVFESSKVAYTYWFLAAIATQLWRLTHAETQST